MAEMELYVKIYVSVMLISPAKLYTNSLFRLVELPAVPNAHDSAGTQKYVPHPGIKFWDNVMLWIDAELQIKSKMKVFDAVLLSSSQFFFSSGSDTGIPSF
jgi:hypothetical protein